MIQRSEILFDDKTSVLLNFRKLKHDEGENSEVVKEITNVISSALIPTLEYVQKGASLGEDSQPDSKNFNSNADRETLKTAVRLLTSQLKSLESLR